MGRRRPRIGGAAMATLTRFNETIMVKVKRVGMKFFVGLDAILHALYLRGVRGR